MFDISWSHLLIFAVAAIVLVPSKDLPVLLRTIGRYVGDARKMAHEFRSQVDEALRETGIEDVKKSVEVEMKGIGESASLDETQKSLNATFAGSPFGAAAAVSEAAGGQIIPSVAASLPVPAEASMVAAAEAPAAPVNGAANGSRAANDGIEIVRAGSGSFAQRAAAGRKKAASHESGA